MGGDVRAAVLRAGYVRARKRESSVVTSKIMSSHGPKANVYAQKQGSEVAWCAAMGGDVRAAVVMAGDARAQKRGSFVVPSKAEEL